MSSTLEFNTVIYDEDDNPHNVLIKYTFHPPIAATQTQPAEGGPELEDIICGMRLSKKQLVEVERRVMRRG